MSDGTRESPWFRSRRASWLAAGLIVLCALAAYANSFNGPFIADDLKSILNNPTIQRLWQIDRGALPAGQ